MVVGITLSGGGAKGDFEVGAVQYLYSRFGVPGVLSGTSVGAINAAKLAEGGVSAPTRLATIWLELTTESDMWAEEAWLSSLQATLPQLKDLLVGAALNAVGMPSLNGNAPNLTAPSLARGAVVGGLPLAAAISTVQALQKIVAAVPDIDTVLSDLMTALSSAQSIYNLGPIAAKLNQPLFLDPGLVAASGIALRIATVGISRGQVRYVTERGTFLDAPGQPPPTLVPAVLASASIPAIFPGVHLGDDTYYDGGVRVLAPVQAAAEAGATTIYAVSASSVTDPGPFTQSFGVPILDLIQRATGLLTTEIGLRELTPPFEGVDATVSVIAPRIEVHDYLTIDPALIRLNIDYGWMCAFDTLDGTPSEGAALSRLADEIVQLRRQNIQLEKELNSSVLPKASNLMMVRANKRRIADLLSQRFHVREAAAPAGWQNWYAGWEGGDKSHLPASSWDAMPSIGVTAEQVPDLVWPVDPPPSSPAPWLSILR